MRRRPVMTAPLVQAWWALAMLEQDTALATLTTSTATSGAVSAALAKVACPRAGSLEVA